METTVAFIAYAVVAGFVVMVAGLILIIETQEKIMSDLDTLNDKVTALEADEASVATDLGVIIADLKASAAPIPQALFDRLDALHVKLQGDDQAAKDAVAPAASVTPVS